MIKNIVKIQVTGRDGAKRSIESRGAVSLMEALRDNGFDEIQALCGGICSCATCHVYVEAGPENISRIGSDTEDALLDMSANRQPNSRLSCQVLLSESLDGLHVRIAASD